MNRLIDYLNHYAERFTYRVMKIIGVPDESLEKYLKAVEERDEKQIDADDRLRTKAPIIKILFYFALMIFGAFLIDRVLNRRRN